MNALRRFAKRLSASVLGWRDDNRLREELAEHLTLLTEEYVRAGLPPDEAKRRARLKLGGQSSIAEAYRDEQLWGWLEDFSKDLRTVFRSVRRYPVSATVAVISLAAGIGATTITLTVRDAVFRKFPPLYTEPQQLSLVHVARADRPIGHPGGAVPAGLYNTWAAMRDLEIAASASRGVREVRADDRTESIPVRAVTPNTFELLGVAPIMGKGFSASANGAASVVLSHRVWKLLFNGRTETAGQILWIDDAPYTVAGVMPERFWLSDMSSPVWTSLDTQTLPADEPVETIVRRPSGISAAVLESQLRTGLDTYVQRQTEGNRQFTMSVSGLEGTPLGRQVAHVLPFFLATAVILTFLIACANVAVLMFAQWTGRDREIAIRASIGASRGRIVRLLLAESIFVAAISGALGVGAMLAMRAALVSNNSQLALFDLSIDPAVFLEVSLVTLLAGILTGIAPALYETRLLHLDPFRAIRGSDRVRQRLRHGLVVFEIAVTVALLVMTASMVDGYRRARQADMGFDARPLLAAWVESPDGVPGDEVLLGVSGLPGVVAVAASTSVPFSATGVREKVSIAADSSMAISTERAAIRGPFFAALGVPIVAGRGLVDGESAETHSAVVNEALARRLFPDGGALGATIWLSSAPHDIVGIARDYASGPLRVAADEPRIFVPLSGARSKSRFHLIVRSAGDPGPLVQVVRREMNRVVPGATASGAHAFEQTIRIIGEEILVGTAPLFPLTSIGTLLTMAGIYGVLAFAVSRRARELAVRVAVGASPQELVWVVARQTLKLSAAGAGIGIALTYGLSRVVRASGGAGSVFDPPLLAFVGPVLAIAALGLIATWIPARRAASINPSQLMREG